MRAAFFEGPNTITVRDAPTPEPTTDGDVRLRVRYCGICGSDLTVYKTGVLAGPDVVLGHEVSAIVDADPAIVGTELRGLTVQHIEKLDQVVTEANIAIAVVAVPVSAAQDVCDRLVAAGVTSILNFAPTVLNVPPHVDVRKVDLAAELQILSFHDNRKSGRGDSSLVVSR